MTIAHCAQTPESDNTRLVVSRVLALLSVLVVIFFVVCVMIAVSALLKYPEQIFPEQWTQAQIEEILLPLAIPTSWLVWSRLMPEIGFAVTAVVIAVSIFIHKPKDLFSYYVAFWLVLHGTFSGIFAETVAQQYPTLAPFTKGLLMLGWWGVFLLAYVFPNGKFIPRWTVTSIPFFVTAYVLLFPPYVWGHGEASPVISGLLLVLAIAGVLAQGYRFARVSTPIERQQTKWVMIAIAARIVYLIVISIPAVRGLVTSVTWQGLVAQLLMGVTSLTIAALLPIAVGMAILHYHLWDLDPILNRTFVYGGLTLFIVGAYGLIVGGTGALLGAQEFSPLLSIITIGLVAIIFQPLRERLQRTVNHLMYGERNDPAAVLTQLAQQLETADTPAAILPNLVQTIAHTLKIPHVAIWLPTAEKQFEPAAVWGAAPDHVEMLPLTYQNETIGHLVVAPRGPHESFSRHEKQLLQTIAALTANTVRAVQLSDELRQSRQRIVTAREDERRRLRRDLHDGLGPQLASQTLGLEAVGQLMSANPEKATQLLASLKTQAQEAIADIRHLIYELRPPTLDDLGLVGALQQSAARYESKTLRFTFEVPEPLPELPAAVETAVYRITQEAMTNIVRHAQASQAALRLTYSGNHLIVEICDNGNGLSAVAQTGVGLQSMRERAAELNGRCMIESLPGGGTKVEARLPLETIDE